VPDSVKGFRNVEEDAQRAITCVELFGDFCVIVGCTSGIPEARLLFD